MNRSDRIAALDILRGLALFGMILVHFHQRMEIPSKGFEDIVGWFVWMGLETKSWALFALLFGAGFAILMRRMEARRSSVTTCFLRRMAALALFGIAVQILFGFSILLEYAIWGVPLLLIRNWPTRALLMVAVIAAVALPLFSMTSPYSRGPYYEKVEQAEAHGAYVDAVKARAENMRWQYSQPRALIPTSSFVLFIFGLLAIRHGVFADPKGMRRVIITAMTAGFSSWVLTWFVLPRVGLGGFGIVSDQWLAFTYAGAIVLLLAYRPQWNRRLAAFGVAGRMALTNYVLQAAIISWISSGYGLSLKIRPYLELPATITVFLVMAALSTLWLKLFPYGPLERIWRAFTYFSWQSPTRATT
jgi:uncharacterized protein